MTVLERGRLTCGPLVERFEKAFAQFVGSVHAICVNSGSSANLLLMAALGLQPGDQVLVPVLTWPTTVAPVIQLGLKPVWIDADPRTFQMDMEEANQELNHDIRAVWVAHLMGNAVDLDNLQVPNGTILLEDCCEGFGTFYGGRHVGTSGLAGTFSFFMTHQLMTGEGGMIVTDEADLAAKLRRMRSHGWDRADEQASFNFPDLGFNFRPTELTGIWGSQQLDAWPEASLRRNELAMAMSGIPGVEAMTITAGTSPAPFAWPVRSKRRLEITKALNEAGVETRPLLGGNLLRNSAFRDFGVAAEFPVADALGREAFYWPCHQGMSDEDAAWIREIVEHA